MEDARVGEWVRSERRRLGLRQADLAARAGVGRSTVARLEAGSFPELTVRAARTVAAAVGIDLPFAPRSRRGASTERQIDWRHAALVEEVLGRLDRLGWEAAQSTRSITTAIVARWMCLPGIGTPALCSSSKPRAT